MGTELTADKILDCIDASEKQWLCHLSDADEGKDWCSDGYHETRTNLSSFNPTNVMNYRNSFDEVDVTNKHDKCGLIVRVRRLRSYHQWTVAHNKSSSILESSEVNDIVRRFKTSASKVLLVDGSLYKH